MFWICSAKVDINPEEKVVLGCGSASPIEPESLLDGLEVNIILVWSQDKTSKVALISVDSLFLGRDFVSRVISSLSGLYSQDEVFIAASHTHSAPMIDETKPRLGKRNDGYARMVAHRIADAVAKLHRENPAAVGLRNYQAKLGGIVQRRNKRLFELSRYGLRWRPTLARPNLSNLVTGWSATITEFFDFDGNVIASIAVVPCHPVATMGLEAISADYVGLLRAAFRREVCANNEAAFVFFQGASGDLVPWWRAKWFDGGMYKFLDQIANGVKFSSPTFTVQDLSAWCKLRIQEIHMHRVEHLQRELFVEQSNGAVRSVCQRFPLSDVLEDAKQLEMREWSVRLLEIGNLRILGISAEVTSEFKKEIGDLLGDAELVGCIDDTFGYATSSRQSSEGGYEVEGHQSHFSITHRLGVYPGEVIRSRLVSLQESLKLGAAP